VKPVRLILLVVGTFPLVARATWAEDHVPASWRVVAEAQEGEISQIAVRGGYVAWLERRLDPHTGRNRARSYWWRLYRKRLDAEECEVVFAPKGSTTSGPHFVLGERGMVSWDNRGQWQQTLFVPGKDPVSLHTEYKEFPFDGPQDKPFRIYKDALLCHIKDGIRIGVSVMPLRGDTPDFSRRMVIVPEADVNAEDYGRNMFWNGRQVFYVKRFWVIEKRPRQRTNAVLYDTVTKDTLWTVTGWPCGLDEEYGYYFPRSTRPRFGQLVRRRVEPLGIQQYLLLPGLGVQEMLDCDGSHLLCALQVPRAYGVFLLDLWSGAITEYDISAPWTLMRRPQGGESNATMIYFPWPGPRKYVRLTGDATTGDLVAATECALYAVPAKAETSIEWRSFGWKPRPFPGEEHRYGLPEPGTSCARELRRPLPRYLQPN